MDATLTLTRSNLYNVRDWIATLGDVNLDHDAAMSRTAHDC